MKHRRGKWIADAPAAENARRELARFAAEYFKAGRKLASRHPSAGKLHAFRLLTKHLRYTLEVFRPLYGPALNQRLADLRKVQTVLGELNDYAATRALMDASPEASHPETLRLRQWLDQQEKHKRREFTELWTNGFDAPGQQARWETYLQRYGRERPGNV